MLFWKTKDPLIPRKKKTINYQTLEVSQIEAYPFYFSESETCQTLRNDFMLANVRSINFKYKETLSLLWSYSSQTEAFLVFTMKLRLARDR